MGQTDKLSNPFYKWFVKKLPKNMFPIKAHNRPITLVNNWINKLTLYVISLLFYGLFWNYQLTIVGCAFLYLTVAFGEDQILV